MTTKILQISSFNQCPLEESQILLPGCDECVSCGVFHTKGIDTIVCLFATDLKLKSANHKIGHFIKY